MEERNIFVSEFDMAVSRLLKPEDFLLEEDVIKISLYLFLKLDMVKRINSLEIILTPFESDFNMIYLVKNVSKDIMVESGGVFLYFLEGSRRTSVGGRPSLNNNILIIFVIILVSAT